MPILWGGATAASQYEGGFEYKKALDTQDCRPYRPRKSQATQETRLLTKDQVAQALAHPEQDYYPFRQGSRGYDHLEEDLDLLGQLGLDIYRFSISWARLFPHGMDQGPDPEALAYYDAIFAGLKARNIKVFLSLYHYAVPLYLLQEFGGWTSRSMIDAYMTYVETIFARWGDQVDYWLPINEINTGYFSPYNGLGLTKDRPDQDYDLQEIFQGLHHQFVASAKAKALAKSMGLKGKFVAMIAYFSYYPLTPKPEDNLLWVKEEQINQWFAADVLMRGTYPYYSRSFFQTKGIQLHMEEEDSALLKAYPADILAISYYSSAVISHEEGPKRAGNLVITTANPYLEASEWGWQIDPVGMRTAVNRVHDRYACPVIISENGLGHRDVLEPSGRVLDPYRIDYLSRHTQELIKANQEDRVPVEAYFAWGIIDIVSAGSCEMEKRYGLVYVDADNLGRGTYQRYKKESFHWYRRFIQDQKGESLC